VTVLRLRREGLTWVETEGEIVVLDMDASAYLSANPTGAVLWSALVGGATRSELVDRLLAGFDVDPQTAERDVDGFVDDLRTRNLLEEE
jgi:coenzyme PQQ synthesis protein D (PqqD)